MSKRIVKKKEQEPDANEHPTREDQTGGSTPVEVKEKEVTPANTPGDDLSD